MIEEAIILAGGFGTRLREVVANVPKPMAQVADRPFLDYLFEYLEHHGVKRAVLSVGFQGDIVQNHYQDKYGAIDLEYAFEEEPLGTGGAIRFALSKCHSENVLILNGDTFFDVDLNALNDFHEHSTMVLREVERPDRYGTLELDESSNITSFMEKRKGLTTGLINGGVYVINKSTFGDFDLGDKFSIENEFFAPHCQAISLKGFVSEGYFIDIGIPEDYYRANDEFRSFKY